MFVFPSSLTAPDAAAHVRHFWREGYQQVVSGPSSQGWSTWPPRGVLLTDGTPPCCVAGWLQGSGQTGHGRPGEPPRTADPGAPSLRLLLAGAPTHAALSAAHFLPQSKITGSSGTAGDTGFNFRNLMWGAGLCIVVRLARTLTLARHTRGCRWWLRADSALCYCLACAGHCDSCVRRAAGHACQGQGQGRGESGGWRSCGGSRPAGATARQGQEQLRGTLAGRAQLDSLVSCHFPRCNGK